MTWEGFFVGITLDKLGGALWPLLSSVQLPGFLPKVVALQLSCSPRRSCIDKNLCGKVKRHDGIAASAGLTTSMQKADHHPCRTR